MRTHPPLLAIAILLALHAAPDSRAADATPLEIAPPRLARDAWPTSESVDLVLDPAQPSYRGRVSIALDVRSPVTELRFHARALTIDSVAVRGPKGRVAVAAVERLAPDQARVRLGREIVAGAYTLDMAFHNDYNTRAISLYKVNTGGSSYLFTQLEDTEAREAFPCWDEPEFKIPWTMALTVPAAHLAVSNTPVTRETARGAMKRVEFAPTPPMSSYLIAIAVGPLETVPIPGLSVPGRVITVRGATPLAAEAVRVTPGILRSLERYFGRPYPYKKLDLIAAPEFLYGAMENAGAVVFADRRLLIDPQSVSPEQQRQLIGVVAHELAHMWFGDFVTMKWWDDLWLNESFASWMATKVTDDVSPEQRAGVTALFSVGRALAIDSRPSTRAMRAKIVGAMSLGQTANELTYNKGQAVLTMFEGWLGPEKFRQGVLHYLEAHAWANAEGRDLWQALGGVSGENVDAAMASFLEQPGVPLVTVEPLPGGRVRLLQRRFSSTAGAPADPALWRIPVILRYPAGSATRSRRVWLTTPEATVDLGLGATPAWIEPNAGASGYYRWSVPEPMLQSLVSAARSSLDVRERIDLVANLNAPLRAGLLTGDRFLRLVARLADDPAPEVVRAVVEALNDTRVALTTPRADSTAAAFLRVTLEPALTRFGMRPAPEEPTGVSLMRPALLRLLAEAGHDGRVIAYAESLSRAYRADAGSVPASVAESGVQIAALHGDRALFDDYRRHFETTTVPNDRTLYLSALGTFRDRAIQAAALDYALAGPLRPQEVLMIPYAMSLSSLGSEGRGSAGYPDHVEAWMRAHFQELRSKLPPNFAARILALGSGCSEQRLEGVQTFFTAPQNKVPGGENTLARLGDVMRECAGLHDRESARVERWLLSGEWEKPRAPF